MIFLNETDARIRSQQCTHPSIGVEFDEEAARGLEAYEVRERWPRAEALCPDCGAFVAKYASLDHYAMGDW